MKDTMQAAVLTPGGDIEGIRIEKRPVPEPGPRQIRVRVQATSLNYRDLLIARGLYPLSSARPLVPLSDGAGVVDAVGPETTLLRTGDRVVVPFMRDWLAGPVGPAEKATGLGGEIDGMLAEYVVLPEQSAVPIPPSLSFEAAATLPCAGVTAWNALMATGRLNAGESILTQGSGGVSVFALQLARLTGARVIATSSGDAKLQRLASMGAEYGINYRTTPDWSSAVLAHTGGAGVDHVVEIGGPATFPHSLNAVRMTGTISVIGVLTGVEAQINLLPMLHKHLRVNGIFVGSRQMLADLVRALDAGKVEPVIDSTFGLQEVRRAYERLASGEHFGKIVIRLVD